jgi:flavin-dependent dehydrogenase
LVGADGINGITSKHLRIRDKWDLNSVALCINAEVPMDPSDIERVMFPKGEHGLTVLDLYFGLVEFGYGWCFPLRESLNIGIGCRGDKAQGLGDKWEKLISHIEKTKGCKLEIAEKQSARVPAGGLTGRYVARRSMLIGDAAGLASPVSGEGISYAIESGILAADVAFDAVREKSSVRITSYEQKLKEGLLRELKMMRSITSILYKSNANIELICRIANEDSVMREYLTDILARVKPNADLWNQVRKRMLLHHPLMAIRLGL